MRDDKEIYLTDEKLDLIFEVAKQLLGVGLCSSGVTAPNADNCISRDSLVDAI